jgi:hypothetical protein
VAIFDPLPAHLQFAIVALVLMDVPFVVGQSVAPRLWDFYWSITFGGAAFLYAVILYVLLTQGDARRRTRHAAPFSSPVLEAAAERPPKAEPARAPLLSPTKMSAASAKPAEAPAKPTEAPAKPHSPSSPSSSSSSSSSLYPSLAQFRSDAASHASGKVKLVAAQPPPPRTSPDVAYVAVPGQGDLAIAVPIVKSPVPLTSPEGSLY